MERPSGGVRGGDQYDTQTRHDAVVVWNTQPAVSGAGVNRSKDSSPQVVQDPSGGTRGGDHDEKVHTVCVLLIGPAPVDRHTEETRSVTWYDGYRRGSISAVFIGQEVQGDALRGEEGREGVERGN